MAEASIWNGNAPIATDAKRAQDTGKTLTEQGLNTPKAGLERMRQMSTSAAKGRQVAAAEGKYEQTPEEQKRDQNLIKEDNVKQAASNQSKADEGDINYKQLNSYMKTGDPNHYVNPALDQPYDPFGMKTMSDMPDVKKTYEAAGQEVEIPTTKGPGKADQKAPYKDNTIKASKAMEDPDVAATVEQLGGGGDGPNGEPNETPPDARTAGEMLANNVEGIELDEKGNPRVNPKKFNMWDVPNAKKSVILTALNVIATAATMGRVPMVDWGNVLGTNRGAESMQKVVDGLNQNALNASADIAQEGTKEYTENMQAQPGVEDTAKKAAKITDMRKGAENAINAQTQGAVTQIQAQNQATIQQIFATARSEAEKIDSIMKWAKENGASVNDIAKLEKSLHGVTNADTATKIIGGIMPYALAAVGTAVGGPAGTAVGAGVGAGAGAAMTQGR